MDPISDIAGNRFFDATNFLLRENADALIKVISAGLNVSVEDIKDIPGVDIFIKEPAKVYFGGKEESVKPLNTDKCRAKTGGGHQCDKNIVCDGYCNTHRVEWRIFRVGLPFGNYDEECKLIKN